MTKNLHQSHPEDNILTGDLSVLDWFSAISHISVKLDGSPAIVWGTNPENGRFFVGTKSVFNKKKIMICYTIEDIHNYYKKQPNVKRILQACFDFLPRIDEIVQADFIGFGGDSAYKPNTVIYDFGEEIDAEIIIAPHTVYRGDTIIDSVASPLSDAFISDENVHYVQPTVDCTERFADSVNQIRSSVEKSKFLSEKVASEVRIILNAFIREGKSISPQLLEQIVGDWNLTVSYFQIVDLKEQMMESMRIYDGPTAFLNGEVIDCEGYVRSNKYGTLKLVDRYKFAQANFNNTKFRSN